MEQAHAGMEGTPLPTSTDVPLPINGPVALFGVVRFSPVGEGHYVAAEGSRRLESKALGGGRYPERWADDVPDGTCHAVDKGTLITVCGIGLDRLVAFPDQPWGRGIGMDWCRACEEVVPL